MCVAVQTDCHTSTRLSGAGISLRPRRLIRCTDVPSSADQKLSAKTESVKDLVTTLAINMEKSFANVEKSFAALHSARAFDRVWWLLMSGALLGVMARTFKWI